jgi:hypothetical protein
VTTISSQQNKLLRFGANVTNWLPGFRTEADAVQKRRGFAIAAYIGSNGSGKSATLCLDTIPTLRGIMWSCENPDHYHASKGIYSGVRRVLSTMRFTTPDGEAHPLYIPLTDYSQLTNFEHGDLILDEVGGAVASSTGDDIPMSVKAVLQEMRRKEVNIRWSAPSWARASKVLRECSLGVTVSKGKWGRPGCRRGRVFGLARNRVNPPGNLRARHGNVQHRRPAHTPGRENLGQSAHVLDGDV